MKSFKYIITGISLLLSVVVLGQKYNGSVSLADEPVKGAKILDAQHNVVAETNAEGMFSLDKVVENVTVKYKSIELDAKLVAGGGNAIVLVPSEKKLLGMIEKNNSIAKCELFLANYPSSILAQQVTAQLEELVFADAYLAAVKSFDVSKLEAYMHTYENGKFGAKAQKTIEAISWQKTRLIDSYQGYEQYIARFPKSEGAQEAAQRLSDIEDPIEQ